MAVPNVFVPDTDALAEEVNENFDSLADGSGDDDGNSLELFRSEGFANFVASGCVWAGDAYGSTLNASMTSGIVYLGGKRLVATSVGGRAFTASKDTYIDGSDNGDGTIALTYTEVANGAASPALASGSIRLGKVVSGASSIAAATSITQRGTDSLSNLMYNTKPARLLSLPTQNDATNTSRILEIKVQGWGYITGNGTRMMTETVTFPDVTFLEAPFVLSHLIGVLVGSNPTGMVQLTSPNQGTSDTINAATNTPTTTTFKQEIANANNTMPSNNRYGYAWEATGRVTGA